MFRSAKVTLESEPPLPVLVDGEVLGSTPAQFEILPGAVQFWAPPAPEKPSPEEKADMSSKIR
jgi:diacylglycerol kinase family enzyme